MRRTASFYFFLVFFCIVNAAHAQEFVEQRSFSFYEKGNITYNEAKLHYYNTYEVINGDKIVFEYMTDNGGDPGNHSKAKTVIAFELDMGIKKFQLKDDEIATHGGIYMQACECQDIGIHPIKKGTITGQKNKDGSFFLTVKIYLSGVISKSKI